MYGSLNNGNVFRNVTLHERAARPISLTSLSAPGQQSRDFVIEEVHDAEHPHRRLLHLPEEPHGARQRHPLCGHRLTPTAPTGSTSTRQLAGDSVLFYRNRVHEIIAVGGVVGCGPRAAAVPGRQRLPLQQLLLRVPDHAATRSIHGISLESGNAWVYFNSIRVDDMPGTGPVYLVYQSTSTGTHVFENNIFYSGRDDEHGLRLLQYARPPTGRTCSTTTSTPTTATARNYTLAAFGTTTLIHHAGGTAGGHGLRGPRPGRRPALRQRRRPAHPARPSASSATPA